MTSPSVGKRQHPRAFEPAYAGWVALGGAGGTALRLLLTAVIPSTGPLPLSVVLVNITGAFFLGLLLAALQRPGPESASRKAARLGLGTGLLGGYTTYSAFAVGADGALVMSDPVWGLSLSVGLVVAGIAAAWSGSQVARLVRRARVSS